MNGHAAAGGALFGAWFGVASPAPILAVLAGALVAAVAAPRWRGAFGIAAVAMIVSVGADHRARGALDFPEPGHYKGWVTMIDDPREQGPVGVRSLVRADGRRLVASAHGGVAGRFDDAAAGERLFVAGSVRPVDRDDDLWVPRHVVGRLTIEQVFAHVDGHRVGGAANAIRATLVRGAAPLDDTERPLFLGMVIGDDREQSAVTTDDFRAAGLGHLLVVSGQNVAFVLAVAMPVVGRLRPGARALALVLVLAMFATVTRFEPSVLRAVTMAGFAVGSAAMGRPVDGRRALSWACAFLVVLDPFLVRVVAFQLSAAATAGIVWGSAPLAARMGGPVWLVAPVSTTVAAQLAVAPFLLSRFGPLPLASLPANVLAGPVSGLVMIWGSTAGLAAGLFGPTVAGIVHLPTRLMLWWVGVVAAAAARSPPAELGATSLAVVAAAVVWLLARSTRRAAWASGATATSVVVVAVLGAAAPAPGESAIGAGVRVVHHAGETVVVLDDPDPPRFVLEALRRAGIRRVPLVVATDGDRADADAVVALRDRFGNVAVAAPPRHRVPGARSVEAGQRLTVGRLVVEIEAVTPRLAVDFIGPAP